MGENAKLFLEIMTPICLAALFVINLLQSKNQQQNKIDQLNEQLAVKEELHNYNGQVRDKLETVRKDIANIDNKLDVHIGRDEMYQAGISRTLTRMDDKLKNVKE
jgi:hypothetical protein